MSINAGQIKADLKKFVETYSKAGAKACEEEFTKQAQKAIQDFYGSYDPKEYIRTDEMLNKSYIKYYHNNGNTIYGGVKIWSDEMDAYKRTPSRRYPFGGGNPANVVEGVWVGGYRGPKAPQSFWPLLALYKSTIENPVIKLIVSGKGLDAACSESYSAITVHR